MSITYTVKNPTEDNKEESGWKVFPENGEGAYFGIEGQLLPDASITRTFVFSVVSATGPLVFVYPAKINDTGSDDDDLIWTFEP